MWTSNRKAEGRTVEAAVDLGVVTLGGDPAGVYLGVSGAGWRCALLAAISGGRRQATRCL